jgi:hypothetical protein
MDKRELADYLQAIVDHTNNPDGAQETLETALVEIRLIAEQMAAESEIELDGVE